jgi:hypothetical protein
LLSSGASGFVKSGLDKIGGAVSSIWNSLKDKDPESWKVSYELAFDADGKLIEMCVGSWV